MQKKSFQDITSRMSFRNNEDSKGKGKSVRFGPSSTYSSLSPKASSYHIEAPSSPLKHGINTANRDKDEIFRRFTQLDS